jgi:hypothetical protein
VAVIAIVAGAVNEAPFAGAVRLTVGGVLVALAALIVTVADVVVAPSLSTAIAVKV